MSYSDPKLAINRVYTRKGDDGTTALVGGQRVAKDDPRIEAYGTVDELNAIVGMARVTLLEAESEALTELAGVLLRVQHELFNLGSILATLPADQHPKQPRVTPADVAALEADMDRRNAELQPLRSFVLPGGCRANAELHLARTVCRRAERLCVRPLGQSEGCQSDGGQSDGGQSDGGQSEGGHSEGDAAAPTAALESDRDAFRYLNRLSDALFVWSRWVSAKLGVDETLWQPNVASSGG